MKQKKKFKRIAIIVLLFGLCSSTRAENTAKESPHRQTAPYMFAGIQGGLQTTFSKGYSNARLITPSASFCFGAFFTPVMGAVCTLTGSGTREGMTRTDSTSDTSINIPPSTLI